MATSQQVFSSWLRARIAPDLRANGYSGSGQDFHRRYRRNWAAINFQRSSWSTASELTFTANLGTKSALVIEDQGGDPGTPPREVECDWRSRIGGLLPDRLDMWWTVRSDMLRAELDVLGETIAGLLIRRAMPELERMAEDRAILESFQASLRPKVLGNLDVVAPILRALGPVSEYERALSEIDALGDKALSLFMHHPRTTARVGPKRAQKDFEHLSSRNVGRRTVAVARLGAAEPSSTNIDAVRAALADPSPSVRGYAAQSLGRLGDVASADRLLAMLASERDRFAAVGAAIGLASLREHLSAPTRAAWLIELQQRREAAAGFHRGAFTALLQHAAE